MGVEVEIKARIEDVESVRERLDRIGVFRRHYYKEDRYFGRSNDPKRSRFRLRHDDGRWVCTYKKKEFVDGVEQNFETEFDVSDGAAFTALAEDLGFFVAIEKRKEGASWLVDGVVAEVSRVNDLGHFIELELILPEDSTERELRNARERLYQLLQRLDIPVTALESRPYTQMIYENISRAGTSPSASL